MSMIRINKDLSIFFLILFSLAGLLLLVAERLSPLVNHAAYYCQSFINTHMIPIPYYVSIIPVFLLFLIVLFSFLKLLALTVKTQYLKHSLKDKVTIDRNINKLIRKLNLSKKVVIISSQEKFAYCLGIMNSSIYLSTGLIAELTLSEIEAVLRHEQYHLERHDTFTMMVASVAYSLFPFFPLLGDLIKKYRIEREILADNFAIQHLGNSKPLISALTKLLITPQTKTVALAAIADSDTLEPRILSLMNKPYSKRQFRLKHVFATLLSAFIIGFLLMSPVHAKEIHHEAHDVIMFCTDGRCMNSCMSESNLDKLYSEIPSSSNNDTAPMYSSMSH